MTDKTFTSEIVIACNPNAVPAEKRQQWVDNGKQVYVAVLEVQEISDCYGFACLPTLQCCSK